MVRLLVEEARDALPLPNHPQCERDVRLVISTSTVGAHPAQRVRSPAPLRSFWSMAANVRKRGMAWREHAERYGKLYDFGPRKTQQNQRS